jgi:hypothetical protein
MISEVLLHHPPLHQMDYTGVFEPSLLVGVTI